MSDDDGASHSHFGDDDCLDDGALRRYGSEIAGLPVAHDDSDRLGLELVIGLRYTF
jgi:hypothetical protein